MNKLIKNCAIIGASGALGTAFTELLSEENHVEKIYAFSRSKKVYSNKKVTSGYIDLENETTVEAAAKSISEPLNLIIIASGVLHIDDIQPEKALRSISAQNFHRIYAINTVGPALVIKHFVPLLSKADPSILAAVSARVGSIEDDVLGGWYAYRASKAALNMLIKNTSIEVARTRKQTIVVGLHPGTVRSALSAPFQKNVAPEKLFEPEFAAQKLLTVLDNLKSTDSGNFFSYAGEQLPF